MATDFFEATQETVHNLNKSERQLFEYVVKNINAVKDMSIREFAATQFLSISTVFRSVKKLGFSGYSDFLDSLLVTAYGRRALAIPDKIKSKNYAEEYLKNAVETVHVMSQNRIEEVVAKLAQKPNIYILTDDNAHMVAHYCERLFIGLEFHAYFPETTYQMQNLVNRIDDKDMIIALSYSGKDPTLIDFVERVFTTARPYLLSVT